MKFHHLGVIAIFTICLLTFSILLLFYSTSTNLRRMRLFYVIAQCKTCERASTLADSDFEKGQYLLIRWGLPERRSIVIGEVLSADYGIEQIYVGCAARKEVDCYTNRMAELVLDKYGSGFYQDVIDKANGIIGK